MGGDENLGTIKLFAFPFAPRGYLPCEGQSLQVPTNAALYSILGNRFGGDGIQTFCLPDLRGKEPIPNTKYYICISGVYPVRD